MLSPSDWPICSTSHTAPWRGAFSQLAMTSPSAALARRNARRSCYGPVEPKQYLELWGKIGD